MPETLDELRKDEPRTPGSILSLNHTGREQRERVVCSTVNPETSLVTTNHSPFLSQRTRGRRTVTLDIVSPYFLGSFSTENQLWFASHYGDWEEK